MKKNFNKKLQILSIGSEIEDLPMQREADISVGIKGSLKHAVDIELKNFGKLKYLTVCFGHWTFLNIARVIGFVFYQSFLLGSSTVIYNFYNEYTVNPLTIPFFEFWIVYILNLLPLVTIGVWDRSDSFFDLIENRENYKFTRYELKDYRKYLF